MDKNKRSAETLEKMTYYENSDSRKSKHRFADSKYRHNVQFLYRLLKENCHENFTKDTLLTTVSDDINRIHNDIISLAGSQKLDKYNEKFLEIVEIGESIWRKEKNPVEWWSEMQIILKNRAQLQSFN